MTTPHVPRHLRHAWTDDAGRLHVPAIDDDDTTMLCQAAQDARREAWEANERERVALERLRLSDALAWLASIGQHDE